MKATLIKENDFYYLFKDKKIIAELNGHQLKSITGKLSKQNCDEIFEVVDVEKLAHEFSQNLRGRSNLYAIIGFDAGFNKAMELNEDKQFTRDDVISAIVHHTYLLYNDGKGYDNGDDNDNRIDYVIAALKQQPTEIEVEITMETISEGLDENAQPKFKIIPKLDKNGCLILKKAPLTERFK